MNDTTDLITWMREQTGIDRSAALQQRGWDRRMAEDQNARFTVPAVTVPPLSELGAPGDPDQVLRDVEAKRRMIDAYEMAYWHNDRAGGRDPELIADQNTWAQAVKLLATAYADRDGYQADAWKPWEPEL